MTIAAVILAGGRGERLGGVDKAELRIGGVRLLDRVAKRFDGCAPRLIASGPIERPGRALAGWISVPDLSTDYGGPLAGVAATIAHLLAAGIDSGLLVVAAVDAPLLPHDYVDRLVAGLGDAPAGIASYAGQPYPTNSIWRIAALAELPRRVEDGTAPHSLKRLSAQLGGTDIAWAETEADDPFANANTPEELAALEARVSGLTD